jgi:hypothetical protein
MFSAEGLPQGNFYVTPIAQAPATGEDGWQDPDFLGLLDSPSEGQYLLNGRPVATLAASARARSVPMRHAKTLPPEPSAVRPQLPEHVDCGRQVAFHPQVDWEIPNISYGGGGATRLSFHRLLRPNLSLTP